MDNETWAKKPITDEIDQITKALGPPWRPDPPDPRGSRRTASDGNGPTIHFQRSWEKPSRLNITGSYPHGYDSFFNTQKPYITVSRTRSPDAIAKDICRRFLPNYIPEYQKRRDLYLQNLAKHLHAETMEGQIADALNGRGRLIKHNPHRHPTDREYRISTPYDHDNPYGHWEISTYSGKIDIMIHNATLEIALLVARAIDDHYTT